MDKDKPASNNNLIKSKSSNSAITTKSDKRKSNKKTRSNAEFQPLVLKKRGVYVEKKPTKTSMTETEIDPVVQTPFQTPARTAIQTPARTAIQTPFQTPAQTPFQTPAQTPFQTPAQTAVQTPAQTAIQTPIRTPSTKPIPRPNRKRFLNSVLNILSQSTTGTQFPDEDDRQRLKKDKTKIKSRKKNEDVSREGSTQSHRKKQKSRARVMSVDSELDQLVVLQSTKEIIRTPSIDSEAQLPQKSTYNAYDFLAMHRASSQEQRERMLKLLDNSLAHTPIKNTNFDYLMQQAASQDHKERQTKTPDNAIQLTKTNYDYITMYQASSQDQKDRQMKPPENHLTQSPLKKVNYDLYGTPQSSFQEQKERLMKIIDKDPSTMVSKVPKKEEKLYNFFVDLIETTFNVYNVKTEVKHPAPPPSSVGSSKVAFEINESVAKKLNIPKGKDSKSTLGDNQSTSKSNTSKYYYIRPNANEIWDDRQLLDHFQPKSPASKRSKSPTKSIRRRRRMKSESFDYKRKPAPNVAKTASFSGPNKKHLVKKARKKNFMKLLKEQLKMEDDAYVEPQNFFQALKVIAKNKRRCQKTIHFTPTEKKSSEKDIHVCQFKHRRILSDSTQSSKKSNSSHPESDYKSLRSFSRNSNASSSKWKNTITIAETFESDDPVSASKMSLEVYGFDYANKSGKAMSEKDDFVIGYESSHSLSETNFNVNQALLKYSESGTSSVLGTMSRSVSGQHGLRTISRIMNM